MKDQVELNNDERQKQASNVVVHDKPSRQKAKPTQQPDLIADLQHQIGNRAIQRLLSRPELQTPTELDDDTANRINRARSDGQALDEGVAGSIGRSLNSDFSGVRVHTSPESDNLTHVLGAKAFTTGRDIFFREGAYEPATSSGQKLIAHELTHVLQQASGSVESGSNRMTVRAPGDHFENQADHLASAVTSPESQPNVQRQVEDEHET